MALPKEALDVAFRTNPGAHQLRVEADDYHTERRLATSVTPPRFHTVKYAGVLAPASAWRSRIRPQPKPPAQPAEPSDEDPTRKRTAGTYRGL